ncbi:MAG: MFS transporter [Acidobacteriota bacterium]|nr:MFS transporter [Acidobacteriota bacterium]
MSEPEPSQKKDYKKIYTLGVLHMAQYFPQGFTQSGLPAIFRQQGLPLEKFWLISSLPMWPRWIKFLVAMAVDNFGSERFGYRRSWILPCTLISALLYVSLAFVQPLVATIGLMSTILVVKSLFMTAQDVAVDAYCSESFTEAERPSGASILAFLASLGGFLGTGIIALVDSIGWSPTMVLASLLLLAAATPAILRPEPPPPPALQRRRERGESATFLRTLRRRDAALIMPHCFAAGWVDSFAFTMVAPFLIDQGMSLTAYGIFIPSIGILGRGSAAYVVPKVIARFGQSRAALVGALGFLGEGAFYCYLSVTGELPPLWRMILYVAGLNFLYMHYVMSLNTSRFRWVSKEQAGTDYSTQSSFYFLGISAGGAASGFAAAALGYSSFFIVGFSITTTIAVIYALTLPKVDAMVDAREARIAADEPAPIEP